MHPEESDAIAQAQWAVFVQQLGAHLAAQWPAMPERLGERYAAFIEHAVQQADKRGITRAAAVARYVNLWFVWGPAFHDKPGFEWAAGLLAAPRERAWSTVHQLVQCSIAELQRLPAALIKPAALAAADARLIDSFGALGSRGDLHPAEPPAAPRRACDLQAVELRQLQGAVDQHYTLLAGQWQRVPLAPPAPLRISAADPAPRLVGALAHAPGQRPQTRLQLRARTHAVCDGSVHPALHVGGTHGLWSWHGFETRALSWPVATLAQPAPAAGPGTAIAEETSPDICKLTLDVCGLRDDGDAIGPVQTQLWVWPATQWWAELQRQAAASQPVGATQLPALRPATRCRVEADGEPHDAAPLRSSFEQGLDGVTAAALQTLLALWSRVDGVSAARLEGSLGLLLGRAALTWGWTLGASGLAGRALMRVAGALEMQACQADLTFDGELAVGGGRARIALRCAAAAPLALALQRDTAEPPLLAALLPARCGFRLPLSAELTPLASDSGALLQAGAPCSGALVGEAGLRPRTSGGSGWEWFASLRLEAAALPLLLVDPVLGVQQRTHALWAAQTLFDWRLA